MIQKKLFAIALMGLVALTLLITACQPNTPPILPRQPNPPQTPPPPVAWVMPDLGPSDYLCSFTETPPKIDGRANDPAWQKASVIDHFTMPWIPGGPSPRNATRARLLWDREYLYFTAEMDDSDLYATVKEHDGRVWENDAFEMFFKPAVDKPGYFEFEVSPINTTLELYIPASGKGGYDTYKGKHPFKFDTAVDARGSMNTFKHDAKGWTVEGRLRWADFAIAGGRPAPGEAWKFALCRVDYSDEKTFEISTTAPLTQPSFHRHEDYGTIYFAPPAAAEKAFGIDQRIPWTTSKVVGYPDPSPPFHIEPTFTKLKIIQPIFIIEDPANDDLLIIQHLGHWAGPGRILRVKNDPDAKESRQVLDLPDSLVYSMAFHPKYKENGWVYVYHNAPFAAEHRFNHLTRYTMDRATGTLDPKSKLEIMEPWETNGHNGGGLEFGNDGMLYFTTGDTSNDSDVENRGQDLSHVSAAVIRIDVDHPEGGKQYGIPRDNPFIDRAGARPEIWAHGFRNPWRMSFDRVTGDLWVGQNGQDLWEPVYVVKKGMNYGWPIYEGSHPFHPHRRLVDTPLGMPAVEHHHSEARSLTGGVVYHSDKFPELKGCYIYGDFSTGRIWAARWDNKQEKLTFHREIARTTAQIINFYADKKGDLFVGDDGGGVLKLVPSPKDAPTAPFPQKLSQTGLFADTARNIPEPALIPYDVNAPLWSDGAAKERFIALPAGESIGYTANRGWEFPNGTVLVKTFSLQTEAGNPAALRRLETRLMVKQANNWDGFTYIWNDAQSDADLAPSAGVDRTYTIKDPSAPGGVVAQSWHYPSRAECMVCHSRAANWALGLSELQMNREFTYPSGVTDNQLRVLEHLGVLQVDAGDHAKKVLRKDATEKGMDGKKADSYASDAMTDKVASQRPFAKSTLLARSPDRLPHMVSPSDDKQDLTARARSYLHANCAHCHIEAGGGNASIDLEFTSDMPKSHLLDAVSAANNMGIKDAQFLSPGHPESSILYHRLTLRGTGQMPPMASNRVDPAASKMIDHWIRSLPAATPAGK